MKSSVNQWMRTMWKNDSGNFENMTDDDVRLIGAHSGSKRLSDANKFDPNKGGKVTTIIGRQRRHHLCAHWFWARYTLRCWVTTAAIYHTSDSTSSDVRWRLNGMPAQASLIYCDEGVGRHACLYDLFAPVSAMLSSMPAFQNKRCG